jgi:hypothetical protein
MCRCRSLNPPLGVDFHLKNPTMPVKKQQEIPAYVSVPQIKSTDFDFHIKNPTLPVKKLQEMCWCRR